MFAMTHIHKLLVAVGIGVVIVPAIAASAEDPALTELNSAFARQRASPAYVEIVFERVLVIPGLAGTVADQAATRIKEVVVEKIENQVAQTTGSVPLVTSRLDEQVERLGGRAEGLRAPVVTEHEVGRVEHSGKREREVMAGGLGEVVRVNGQAAYRFHLPQQVAAMQLAAAAGTAEAAIQEAHRVRGAIDSIVRDLAQGNVAGAALSVISGLDELSLMLGNTRTTVDLIKATAALERLSGVWQCQPDAPPPHNYRITSVEPLEDEPVNGVMAHVYLAHRAFGGGSAARADDDDGSAPPAHELLNRIWIRASDGLPLRSELTIPGGSSRRTDFDYPSAVEIPMPECAPQS